ncbi:MAG: glycosyltransferase family 39 protein, partial [Anaerolineae bacterium]|nr:glycosyltransferase family 39 protein [Anaerolineae bacterium]
MNAALVHARQVPVWGLWLVFACVYALSLGRSFFTSDGDVMFKTTAALVENGSLALDPDPGLPQIVPGQGGRYVSKYDPGLPLLAVPFYVTGDWIGRVNHAHRYRLAATAVQMIPVLAAAGALAALAALAGRLFDSRRAVWITLAAGLATALWPYARTLFAEAVLACALTAAVWLVVRGVDSARRGWMWHLAAGVVFGGGVLTRAALGIYALPLLVLIVRLAAGKNDHHRALILGPVYFALGVLPFVGLLLWFN